MKSISTKQNSVELDFKFFLVRIAAGFLLITGLLKLLDVTATDPYFQEPDRLIPFLNHRQVMIVGSGLEIVVSAYIWFRGWSKQAGAALIWFCSILALYKLGLYYVRDAAPCSCLGILGRLTKLSNPQLNTVTWFILMILALIGASAWYEGWRKESTGRKADG